MTHDRWTVQEVARSARVSARTVYRWVSKGAVPVWRTPTGRIRIDGNESEKLGQMTTHDDNRRQLNR